MTNLRYYTSSKLEELRETVADRLDWYYAPEGTGPAVICRGFRESQLKTRGLANQVTMDAKRPFETDVQNALVVYESLSALTPHQASFERLWAYLSHCDCPQYVSWRWLQHRPEKQRDAVRKVLNHFFATGNRGIIRDNGVSRLWWLGKIAHDIASANPLEFLTILLHRQDVRSALIERPSVSMNRRVLQGIYTVMQEQWANGGGLFERDTFRSWMVALNRRGGVVLLDSLPVQTLKRLLREEAGRALSDRRQRGG